MQRPEVRAVLPHTKAPGGSDRVDFAGYEVSAIELRLDEVLIESPGSDPNEDGVWTDFTIRGELIFYGNWPMLPTRTPTRSPTLPVTATPVPTRDQARESPTALPTNTPTAGPPFPGADQWLLRLPGMQLVYLDPTSDGGYVLTARVDSHRSDLTALFRLNARGEVLWQRQFSGYDTIGAFDVADGGLVLFSSWGLVKFADNGEFEWYEPLDYAEGSPANSYYGQLLSTQSGSSGQTIAISSTINLLAKDGSLLEQQALLGKTPDEVHTRWLTTDANWSAGPIDYEGFFVQRLSANGASWLRRFDLTYTGSDVNPAGMSIIGTRDGGALFVALVPYLRGDLAYSVPIWAVRLNSQGDILWQAAIDEPFNTPLQFFIDPEGDEDWHVFRLRKQADLVFSLFALPKPFGIEVYSQTNFVKLGGNDTPNTEDKSIRIPQAAEGYCLVRVWGINGAWSPDTPYTLLVTQD